MPTIADLEFKDMYVRICPECPADFPSRFHRAPRRGEPTARGNVEVPPEFNEDIEVIRTKLKASHKDNFAIQHEGMRLRAVRYKVVNGQTWASLRRIAGSLPILDDLNHDKQILKAMRSWGKRKGGLVIIAGSTGSGKTTTAVALLRDWLHTYGGTLYTIEDPVEYIMQGQLGPEGFVIQREVAEDHEWGEAVKDALRSAPNYIFLGEVRSAVAARQLLRAATSGHLAICTLHGNSVSEGIGALVQIVESELGSTLAYALAAEALTACIYQEIQHGKPVVGMVETDPTVHVDSVRAAVRSGKLITLGTEIARQEAIRKKGGGLVLKGAGGATPSASAAPAPSAHGQQPPETQPGDQEGSREGGEAGGPPGTGNAERPGGTPPAPVQHRPHGQLRTPPAANGAQPGGHSHGHNASRPAAPPKVGWLSRVKS
jgi:twitching motility protein PilT